MNRIFDKIIEWLVYFLIKISEGFWWVAYKALWLDDKLIEWIGYESSKKDDKDGH